MCVCRSYNGSYAIEQVDPYYTCLICMSQKRGIELTSIATERGQTIHIDNE